MFKKQSVILLLFFTALAGPQAPNAAGQQDEIEALIRDVSADTQKGAIFGYTYEMKVLYNRPGKFGGRKFTRLYEAIIPNRFSLKKTYSHPLLLIRDSEKAITAQDIESMRDRLVEELERAEREAEADPNKQADRKDGGYWTIGFKAGDKGVKIDVVKLLENARFANLQKSESGGRKIILLDFAPKTDSNFEPSFAYLGKIEGRIWIDEADKRIMKIEGYPLGTIAALNDLTAGERPEKTVFLFAQKRVAQGYWFPQEVFVDFTKNPEIFETVRIEFSFDKYSKAITEVRSTEVIAPKDTAAAAADAKEEKEGTEKQKSEKQKSEKQKSESREKDQ